MIPHVNARLQLDHLNEGERETPQSESVDLEQQAQEDAERRQEQLDLIRWEGEGGALEQKG